MTVGRGWNTSRVRHRSDGTKTFRGLSVSHDLATRCINTGIVGIISIAGFEDFVLGSVGGIVSAANAIVNMLTKFSSVGSRWIAGLHTEGVSAHEANIVLVAEKVIKQLHCNALSPFNDLNISTSPSVREHNTTQRVTTKISTVRIQFTSVISSGNVDVDLIYKTNDLNVVRGLEILKTSDRTSRNKTCAVTRLCTPGNFLAFCISNGRV